MRLKFSLFLSLLLLPTLSSVAHGAGDVDFYRGHKVRRGEFLVKLRNPTAATIGLQNSNTSQKVSSKTTNAFFSKAHQSHHMHVETSFSGLNLHHMKMNEVDRHSKNKTPEKSVDEQIDDLKTNPEVAYVEPNYIVEKADIGPSAQSYSLAQVQSFIGTSYGLTQAAIQAQVTWPTLTVPGSVTVAVVDTGIDFNHPSFSQSFGSDRGWNYAYGSSNAQDDEGHGTHVSGIIVGVGNNIFQTHTQPTKIQIMPIKFLDSSGSGATSDAIKAIYYAVNNGAKVINNSWGGGSYSQSLAESISYAYQKDVVFVAAAGNSGLNNDSSPSYPANYDMPNVIAVAATDDLDNMANFSNYGRSTVGLSAPGVSILSTYPGGAFAYLSGTSMAAPFASGVAALMRSQSPSMNCYQIKQLLLAAVDKKANLANTVQSAGRVNVLSSVNAATTTAVDGYKPNYILTINPADRNLAGSMVGRGGGCGMISKVTQEQDSMRLVVVTLALILIPLMITRALKNPEKASFKRRFERFNFDSQMTLKLGGQELVGSVKTISLGGSEINTEALLKNGSVIDMTISSPDGKEKIQVQGHIVWSESQKRYGVAFESLTEGVKTQITQWQKVLVKQD